MHANTIKFFAVICLALTVLIALIAFVPTYVTGQEATQVGLNVSYNYEKIKNKSFTTVFTNGKIAVNLPKNRVCKHKCIYHKTASIASKHTMNLLYQCFGIKGFRLCYKAFIFFSAGF